MIAVWENMGLLKKRKNRKDFFLNGSWYEIDRNYIAHDQYKLYFPWPD